MKEYQIADKFGRSTLKGLATDICALHPLAEQYIEQAPVLLLTASFFPKAMARKNADTLTHFFENRARLRTLLEAHRIAYQFRRILPSGLPAQNVKGVRAAILMMTVYCNRSTLAQSIPEKDTDQRTWLVGLGNFQQRIDRRIAACSNGVTLTQIWNWAPLAFSRDPQFATEDLGDFIIGAPSSFNFQWSCRQAFKAMETWHEEVNDLAESFEATYGVGPDDPVGAGAFPDQKTVRGFDFNLLNTGRKIMAEGRLMRHCVGSYFPNVKSGVAIIYSIRRDEKRIATMEIDPLGAIQQLKGKANSKPPEDVRAAAKEFCRLHKEEFDRKVAA